MLVIKRFFAVVLLLLSAAGIVLCWAGIVGAWMARTTAIQRGNQLYSRVDDTLARVERGTGDVHRILDNAAKSLREMKSAQTEASGDPQKETSFRDWALRKTAQDVNAQMGDVRPMLGLLADALVVAESVTSELQATPAESDLAFKSDRLEKMNGQIENLSSATDKLRHVLGDSSKDSAEVRRETLRVEEEIEKLAALAKEYEDKVIDLRDRAGKIKTDTEHYLLIGCIAATVLLTWFAIAQVSLFAVAGKWLRRKKPAKEQNHKEHEGHKELGERWA
jgi:chromosome segregation ATPase